MESMEQWKVLIEHWSDQFHQLLAQFLQYFRQIPPHQLYVAIAVTAVTVLLLLLGKFTLLKSDNLIGFQ